MTSDPRRTQVEDACTKLLLTGQPITFDTVAARAGLGRATLYRNTDLRAIVEEHPARGREAYTLTGLATGIEHLRTALGELAANVKRHEEELRRLREQTTTAKNPEPTTTTTTSSHQPGLTG